MDSASKNPTEDTPHSEIRKYPLRDKIRTAQRVFCQSKSSEINTTPEPLFLKNLSQKGYQEDVSSDSDEEMLSGESRSNRKRMASNPKNGRGKRRKIIKPLLALTHGRMNSIIKTCKQELGKNVKVTETRIMNDFIEQENLGSPEVRVSRWAKNRIVAYRKKLCDLKTKKKDCLPLDDVVFDLKDKVNPVVTRGPRCQFSKMTREGQRKRIIKSFDRIQKSIIQICDEDDIPIKTMNIHLKKKYSSENIKNGPSGIEAPILYSHITSEVKTKEEDLRSKTGGFLCPACGEQLLYDLRVQDEEHSLLHEFAGGSAHENGHVTEQDGCCVQNKCDVLKSELKTEQSEFNGEAGGFLCSVCGEKFLEEDSFIKHINDHVNNSGKHKRQRCDEFQNDSSQ
ncbi:uncharacterized protein LOC134812578 [Bolinopsis microptera]|uniref:uncharacterized protein LOC134812578 n=1 Tax=Bolinopsis microptera TaxID=2820187 RepID=UPI00307ADEE7